MSDDAQRIARAYVNACTAELQALKPGNVHVHADGHGMTVREFELSAQVTAPVMGDIGLSVGARIHEAVRRTREAVGCNTNLGIVLLCAPLASAAFAAGHRGDLRRALRAVLARLDVNDAEQAFAAIRLAAPAGLGTSAEHDVHARATVTLREAMAAARDRDRIAAQYVTDYADVFDFGMPRLERGLRRWQDLSWAATSAYLGFLSTQIDSHIERKHGAAIADEIRHAATPLDDALLASDAPEDQRVALMAFDAALKSAGHNPGTSADLTVASLFALGLQAS